MATATTEAQVANLALAAVGQRQYLDRLDEDSAEAEACNRLFGAVRNELLAKWPWRFAQKRAVLALTAEVRSGWGYCYAAPADMLVARRIWDGLREPGAGERAPFSKELNDDSTGHLICTDMTDAELLYTVELKTVALWPPGFVVAVAAQLAVYLAGALAAKPQLLPMLQQQARIALQNAAAVDANEAEVDREADSEIIRERG
jgi:hypothetical protein